VTAVDAAVERMRAWAEENPSCDTQGLTDDEWEAMAIAAIAEDDPNSDVLAIGTYRNNADLIARGVAPMGYLDGRGIDLTLGEHGGFWTAFRPTDLTTNDRYRPADFNEDFCSTHWESGAFRWATFDPPYALRGTPSNPEMDRRFGVEVPRTRAEIEQLLYDGIDEAARITTDFVLVKCQPQVNGGLVRWQPVDIMLKAESLGMITETMYFLTGYRKQPAGVRCAKKSCGWKAPDDWEPIDPDGPLCPECGNPNLRGLKQSHPINNYSVLVVLRHTPRSLAMRSQPSLFEVPR
jgi:hypothetical protein